MTTTKKGVDAHHQLVEFERQLSRKSEFQAILMKVATDYINIPLDQVSDAINRSLREIGLFVDADRSYIFDYDHAEKTASNTYEYCKSGIAPEIENLKNIPYDLIPDWTLHHFNGKTIYIPSVEALPEGNLRELLSSQGIRSLITLPMMDHNVCLGFVGFDSVRVERQYSEEEIGLLTLYSQMLINLYLRRKNENEITAMRDRLELALNEEIEVNRMKTRFITMTSHQFRSPITTIQASAELLNFALGMQDFQGKEKMLKHLGRIFNEVDRLTSLLNDVHFIGRAEADRVTFEPTATDMVTLIRNIAEQEEIQPGDTRKASVSVSGTPRTVYADPQLIGQLIHNLLSNAFKYSSGAKPPEVELAFGESALQIIVSDFGIGIPEADIGRMFGTFARASNVENINGTGLGLSIVKHITDLHNGTVAVRSKLNGGSVFTVELRYHRGADA